MDPQTEILRCLARAEAPMTAPEIAHVTRAAETTVRNHLRVMAKPVGLGRYATAWVAPYGRSATGAQRWGLTPGGVRVAKDRALVAHNRQVGYVAEAG